jgi:arabinofuranan 3-O-arabinosyltransferase
MPFTAVLGFWVGGVSGVAVVAATYLLGAWLRPLREAGHLRAGPRGRLLRLLTGPYAGICLYLLAAAWLAVGFGGLWSQVLCLPLLAQLSVEVAAGRRPVERVRPPAPVAEGDPSMTGAR